MLVNPVFNILKNTFNNSLESLKDKFLNSNQIENKTIEIMVNDLTKIYTDEMNNKKGLELENFDKSHQEVSSKLIEKFVKKYNPDTDDKINYLKKLQDNLESRREEIKFVLELQEDKLEMQNKSMRQNFRRFYKDEIEKVLRNKLYVPDKELQKYHRKIIDLSLKVFESESKMSKNDLIKEIEDSVSDIFKA